VYRFTASHYDVSVTDVIRVTADNPDPAAIARAADCLRNGGLVAFPTETVYGLGVNALSRPAVQRLFAAKERPAHDPLIVHVGAIDSLAPLVMRVPEQARVLARHFWPGPLTLVLTRSALVPDEVTAGLPSVAVRVPVHPVARALIGAAAVPIAAPSANLFSRPSPTQASHVLADLEGRIDLIVDAGPATIGVESTVLDLTTDPPTILRPGAVTIEMLQEVLERVAVAGSGGRDRGPSDAPMPSPGMLERHYSPRAALTLFEGAAQNLLQTLVAAATMALAAGQSVGIIAAEEDREALASLSSDSRVLVRLIGRQDAPDLVAARLYSTLRELDAGGADVIYVRGFSGHGLWAAVQDRLRRAAAGRIIQT
jgi:L-threonylcarbamoyladenylate synthase